MSKREKYSITEVKVLPATRKKAREPRYDRILNDLEGKGKGYYQITIEGKAWKTVYPALNKRIKDRKLKMRLLVRGKELFIEKLE